MSKGSDETTTEEGKKLLKCGLCEAKYQNYVSLVRHYSKKHKEAEKPERVGDYKCEECGESFKDKQVLEQHKKKVHNKPKCRFCGEPQSNLHRHEEKCKEIMKRKKTERKKKRCPNCSLEVVNLPSHMKICLKKNTKPPIVKTPSMSHQEKFGLPMTSAEADEEVARLGFVAEMVQEMEMNSVTIASREGISLRVGVKTFANG